MAEPLTSERPEKLSIIIFSGHFDKIHYALVMASAAAAIDTPVTLFFAMEGARALLKEEAWKTLPTTTAQAGGTGDRGADMDADFIEHGVAGFEELLAACRDLGVRFLVCEMGLKTLGLNRGNLRQDLDLKPGSVVSFLTDAHKHGAVLFI